MPLVRTAVTAGYHIDWITTSPEAIRLTDSLKSFHSARNWPAFLASISVLMVRSISFLRHVALVGVLVEAHSLHHHRRVHDADRGDVQDRRLALELGVEQLGPGADRALDQVGADAQRVGVVDGGDQRHELRRLAWRSSSAVLYGRYITFFGAGALVADLLAGHLALGEQAG